MGICTSKPPPKPNPYAPRDPDGRIDPSQTPKSAPTPHRKDDLVSGKQSPFFPFYSPSPAHYFLKKKSQNSPLPAGGTESTTSTPGRFFRRSFAPPSPAKHIRAVLARRLGKKAGSTAAIPEEGDEEGGIELDKRFGFSKEFTSRLEVGEEVGRGHFGYTCSARFKKGELKGQQVAVKVIPKAKMTTAIAIEDVRREVKILRALTGRTNLVQFYEAFEDHDNVYIVMELCEGGELLDRILSRGGKYSEEDAKAVMVQILTVVAFCHLQGVVHRDLKPENFLYTSKDENAQLKAIDFGLSDFVKPDERLNDIVGSAYYVAPEVLHRSYGTEADVWSIGVIAYILLCGSRPFWARTESGIFRAVLKADLSFDEGPWPSLSSEAKDFVKRLLNKDPRKRLTAAQALSHPWIRNYNGAKVPIDILIFKLMRVYMRSSSLRKAALRAVSKTLTVDELSYLKEQFELLEPNKNGFITLETIKMGLAKHATDAMNESHTLDFLANLNTLQYRGMDFEEFCAAALSIHQLEALDRWEQHARCAYEIFEKNGNRAIVIEELASELGLGPAIPLHVVLQDWIRHTDGKLSFLGFVKLLHGVSSRSLAKVS
ncbi:CDPK-related protein kinase-like [Cucurbita pepo subsp. pepo]|uniref:CDPK-related protein kinase-like n=1 Tax=Cucurbita pepo subsp. pepo TaxID=3664 RepID=UPI000C9D7E08|nr:CDPK-related protein kinase-like [Cucurbita pepo subsp. pepo]